MTVRLACDPLVRLNALTTATPLLTRGYASSGRVMGGSLWGVRPVRTTSDDHRPAFGLGVVAGFVVRAGAPDVPVRRPVYLLRRADLSAMALQRTVSAPDGAFNFRELSTGEQFVVLSLDVNAQYDAVVHDRITPELP